MSRFIFKTRCPECDNSESILWRHDGCGGTAYINKQEYVQCEYCHQEFKLKDLRFNGSSHTFFYRPGNLHGYTISKWPC